jgi:hypothetical protein
MKKILFFIDTWGLRLVTILVLIIFLKTCSTNSKIKNSNDEIIKTQSEILKLNKKLDSLTVQIRKEIRIEGLKSEKRMIQSTDRKILDVNRQTEIDKEIQSYSF